MQPRAIEYATLILILSTGLLASTATAKDGIETAGDMIQILIPTAAYGATFYLNDEGGRSQFHYSFFTNLAVTHGLKSLVGKERPDGSDDKSFPSGHTSAAFQGATFIHQRYGFKYAVPAYLGASFVGYSRIAAKKHDITDVVVGALIGAVSSFYFTDMHQDFIITPIVDRDQYGLIVTTFW